MLGLTLLASVLTLVKFTVGFGSIAALLMVMVFSISDESIKQKLKNLTITLVIYAATLSLLGYWLGITNIITYITSGLGISNGFSDAMALIFPITSMATKIVLTSLALLAVWVLIKSRHHLWRYSFLIPPLYIVWKYAVVRQDGHILVILYMLPPLIVMFIYSLKKPLISDAIIFMSILIGCLLAAWANGTSYTTFRNIVYAPVTNIQTYQFVKFWDINSQRQTWYTQTTANLQSAKLPASMRRLIGNSGVDIFPFNTDIVYANNLTWDPRPSPFSFETYTPKFDAENANFFNTDGSKFIIWHSFGGNGLASIDGRNVLWDEPMTLQSILEHYQYVAGNSEFILLERLNNPKVVSQHYLTPRD